MKPRESHVDGNQGQTPTGKGEMAELIRALDWSRTPIGPQEQWPASLRAIVDVMIATQFPVALLWGQELILIYNDAYRVICGDKHPAALGRSTREIWSEVWHINEPIFAAVMDHGETLWFEDSLFPINRRGQLEDAYFTLCYSPVRKDDGSIGGVFVILEETTERIKSVQALRASETKYRDLFNNLNSAFILAEPILDGGGRLVDLTYLMANPAVSKHLNKHPEELVGRRYSQVFHYHGRNPVFDIYENVLSTGDSYKGEVFLPALNRHCELAVYRPAPSRLALVVTDITQRKLAEATLERTSDTLAEAQKIAHVGSFEYIAATRTTVWSEEEHRIYGLDPTGPSPTYEAMLRNCIHPDDAALLHETFTRAMQGGSVYELEHRIVRPDGSVRWVHDRAQPYFDTEGKLARYIGTTLDITERRQAEAELELHREHLTELVKERTRELETEITERRQAEAALHESEERFQLFMDNSPTVAWIKDEQGRYVYLSRTYEERFGVRLADWCGKTDADIWSAEIAEKFRRNDRAVLDAGHALQVEEETINPDGSHCYWLNCKFPFSDTAGHRYVAGIGMDITLHKRAETLFLQAQKMETVGRLAGGVAHEFNNLLLGIIGYTEQCRDKITSDHPICGYLAGILDNARRSADMINKLLTYARKQIIKPAVIDLNDQISESLELLRSLIGENISLTWRPGPGDMMVMLDPTQLDQILTNFVLNARDAISQTGKLTITTQRMAIGKEFCAKFLDAVPGEYVKVAVSDNGCGMDKATLENLFEPFFTTKGPGKATGLGLATVHGIVKQNKGFITVDSEPGKGTTFDFYLPRCVDIKVAPETSVTVKPVTGAIQAELPRGTETILIVDDDQTGLLLGYACLKTLGYSVLTSESPIQALQLVANYSGTIHLLLTDVIMPNLNGRDLARQLMAQRPELKCIFMSGYTAEIIAQQGILEQDVNLLPKPYTRDQLARKVREVLERK